jgi:hypothetical protein
MDSDFSLNKLGWFTVDMVEENHFLNDKLESDQYGIFYSVKFEGNAEAYLWQAKTAPAVGQKVYGHLELTKTGKSTKFKRASKDQTPAVGSAPVVTELPSVTPKGAYKPDTQQESIARSVALKAAVDLFAPGNAGDITIPHTISTADQFLAWLSGESAKVEAQKDTTKPTAEKRDWSSVGKHAEVGMSDDEVTSLVNSIDNGTPFDLNDIPFGD